MKLVYEKIVELMMDELEHLKASGIVENNIEFSEDSILIGANAIVDSIGFVTFFMELEERLSELMDKEIYLIIEDIHEFNPENTFLTIRVLGNFIENMTANE